MLRVVLFTSLFVYGLSFQASLSAQSAARHHLVLDSLPARWDEALPLGNGQLGVLVWEKNGKLRLSLDRADLWDDRSMPGIDQLSFDLVVEKVKARQYKDIQALGDEPYETYPAPTKLPGAALEFDLTSLGDVQRAELDISTGQVSLSFSGGASFRTYVHAEKDYGYFEWKNLPAELLPALMPPNYHTGKDGSTGNSVEGQGLERLGYAKGDVARSPGSLRYRQPTWGQGFYEALVSWQGSNGTLSGFWTLSNGKPARLPGSADSSTHQAWWKHFWEASTVSLPDPLIERQYYLDTYKLGCVARSHTPAITLQAVWTADNGSLPPWKGDFHHDLNTQLSYWPTYSGNRLALAASFTNWMWGIRKEARAYTKHYFGKPGLNVPGVTTISGKPMGGWIQYSMSPAISAWLAQHFYWEWKYGMDQLFLRKRAWPWVRECARFLEHLTYIGPSGKRRLPLSSSPEYHDNRIEAWFEGFTNHDLALAHFAFQAAAELALALGKDKEAAHWQTLRSELPALDQNQSGLTIAAGQNLDESHRHHAHLIGIYPLAILNPDVPADSALIRRSLAHLQQQGTRLWTGYSFAWAASLYAQARDAENAARNLQIFASNFVSTNSFHLNGDQKGGQYSNFTYRPFTLEGNFAFAQGVHEMLLQSNKGYIEVFPAVPDAWTNLSFHNLRTEGGFLVSAEKVAGTLTRLEIFSEKGGTATLVLPGTARRQQVLLQPGERKVVRID